MSDIKTGLMFSPLTERIFWGKINQKTGVAVGGNQKDITSDFIEIMLQKFPIGTRQNITVNGETEAVVIVVNEDVADRFGRSKEVEAQRDELLEEHKEWASLIGKVYLMLLQGMSGEAADLIAESQVIDFPKGEPVAVSDAINKAEGGE